MNVAQAIELLQAQDPKAVLSVFGYSHGEGKWFQCSCLLHNTNLNEVTFDFIAVDHLQEGKASGKLPACIDIYPPSDAVKG